MTSPRAWLASAAFQALPSEAAILDTDGVILVVNDAWRRFGRDNGAGAACGPGVSYLAVCERAAGSGDQVAGAVGAALAAVLGGDAPLAALDYPCPSAARERWFQLRASPLPCSRRVLVLHDDVTARVREVSELRHLATHDALTGLPNRLLLYDRLAAALHTRDRRHPPQVAVLVVDLDMFKRVNDEHGHVAGDMLLAVVAQRLQSLVRCADTVARWGGDEFVTVLPDCPAPVVRRMLTRIADAVAEPVALPGQQQLTVTASIGLSLSRPGEDARDPLHRADQSLRAAKRRC